MSALTITKVEVVPDYSTVNRGGITNPSGQIMTLYVPAPPPIPEGDTGTASASCCTLNLKTSAAGARLPLMVSGTCPDLATTLKEGFVLKALFNNNIVFSTPTIPSPGIPNFVVPLASLDWAAGFPIFPCRLGGTWAWTIGPPGGVGTIFRSQDMLLEICFVWSGPPAGPLNPSSDTVPARPDFQSVFPVDLFRLFLPMLGEFPPPTTNILPWYLNLAMSKIWDLGLKVNPDTAGTRTIQYEIMGGAPAYIEGYLGGEFQLRRFIKTFIGTVNCYDLAGIAQLAVAIIKDASGIEIFNSRWIFCDQFGYINPGPLIGWPQFPTCNSPFFATGQPFYQEPPDNASRTAFGNHAWVEVSPNPASTTDRRVLDATHCLEAAPNSPAAGTQDRKTYEGGQIQQPRSAGFIQTYELNPGSRLDQIGVTSIGTLPSFTAPPPDPTIAAEPAATQLVNNASCDPSTILSLFQKIAITANIESTDTLVGSAGCQVLTNITDQELHKEPFHIKISNFERSGDAATSYARQKSSLQRILPRQSFLTEQAFGNEAICTSYSALFRRNSLVTRVFTGAVPRDDPKRIEAVILGISTLLDDHIKSNAVRPGLELRPTPELREKIVTVRKNSHFSVQLDKVTDAMDILTAEVENHSIVLSAGPADASHTVPFHSMDKGQTTVKICTAHKQKLTVSVVELLVKVID